MPKYDVYILGPYMEWIGVDADDEDEAIAQCDPGVAHEPSEGPYQFVAIEQEGDSYSDYDEGGEDDEYYYDDEINMMEGWLDDQGYV